MGIKISGVTREQVEEPPTRKGLRTFPFSTSKWTTHFAQVEAIEIQKGKLVDYLILKGRNGEYGVRLSVQLDPSFVANDFGQNRQEIVERNTDRLVKLLKAFDLAVFEDSGEGVWLEPDRFPGAVGKAFAFSIKGATNDYGQPKFSDRGIAVTWAAFKGLAPELRPVVAPSDAEPPKPVGCALSSPNMSAPDYNGDGDFIPF
jgi:hypothetical protein